MPLPRQCLVGHGLRSAKLALEKPHILAGLVRERTCASGRREAQSVSRRFAYGRLETVILPEVSALTTPTMAACMRPRTVQKIDVIEVMEGRRHQAWRKRVKLIIVTHCWTRPRVRRDEILKRGRLRN